MIINYGAVILILLLASITDIKSKIISDKLLLTGLFAGIALLVVNPLIGFTVALINLALIAAVLLAVYFVSNKAIGLGDVKLIALFGVYLPLSNVIMIAIVALVLSGILSVFLLLLKKVKKDSTLPFAPFLLAASIIMFLYNI